MRPRGSQATARGHQRCPRTSAPAAQRAAAGEPEPFAFPILGFRLNRLDVVWLAARISRYVTAPPPDADQETAACASPVSNPSSCTCRSRAARSPNSTHRITHWGVVGAKIVTEDGLEGYGFTGTHAHLRLRPADHRLHPRLLCAAADRRGRRRDHAGSGSSSPAIRPCNGSAAPASRSSRWRPSTSRSGTSRPRRPACRSGICSAARRSRSSRPTTPISAGSRSRRTSSSRAPQAVEHDGFRRIKIKVGHADPGIDIDRLEAVRRAVGAHVTHRHRRQRQMGPADLPALLRAGRGARHLLVRGADVVRRCRLARGAGALDLDPGRARRAALFARRLPHLHRGRRDPLRPARRDPARRHHRIHPGRRSRARAAGCRSRPMPAR